MRLWLIGLSPLLLVAQLAAAAQPSAPGEDANSCCSLPKLAAASAGGPGQTACFYSKTYQFMRAIRQPRRLQASGACAQLYAAIDEALDVLGDAEATTALVEAYNRSTLYPVLQSLRAEGCNEMLIEEDFADPLCTALREQGRQALAALEYSPLYEKVDSSQAMHRFYCASCAAQMANCFLELPDAPLRL